MTDIQTALTLLAPGAEWSCANDDYDQITWYSTNITKPTRAQVDAKIAELVAAEPMRLLRIERDRLLAETDWTQNRDVTLSNDAEWAAYRQALRDLPDNSNPVLDYDNLPSKISGVTWPTKPL